MNNKKLLQIHMYFKSPKKGFTVLFAVLVSSLVLAIGLGIVSITLKEIQLSGAGRDSELAFYAADSGSECAFYWDLKGDNFATFTVSGSSINGSLKCAGGQILANNTSPATATSPGGDLGTVSPEDSTHTTTTFWVYMSSNSGGTVDKTQPCAEVKVIKDISDPNKILTTIDSRGYNTCEASNPRRLERGYQISY